MVVSLPLLLYVTALQAPAHHFAGGLPTSGQLVGRVILIARRSRPADCGCTSGPAASGELPFLLIQYSLFSCYDGMFSQEHSRIWPHFPPSCAIFAVVCQYCQEEDWIGPYVTARGLLFPGVFAHAFGELVLDRVGIGSSRFSVPRRRGVQAVLIVAT